jgi:hypothetical protein
LKVFGVAPPLEAAGYFMPHTGSLVKTPLRVFGKGGQGSCRAEHIGKS